MADASQNGSLVKAVAKTEAILKKQLLQGAPNHYILHWKPELVHAEAHADNTSRIVWRFCCPAEYRNPVGHAFGGAIATLLDVGTSLCLSLIGKPKFYSTLGASRNLNVTFLKPAKIDEALKLNCKVINAGNKLALIRGDLHREEDGALVATCEHNKYNWEGDSPKL